MIQSNDMDTCKKMNFHLFVVQSETRQINMKDKK